MSDKQSEYSTATTAATEQVPASTEAPPAAETVSAASSEAAAAAGGDTDTSRDGKGTREQSHAKAKSKKRTRRAAGERASHSGAAKASEPGSLATRLLAPLKLPRVLLDRRLLPTPLLGALDAAGLAGSDLLPATAFMTLAAIGAVAGPNLRCEPVDDVEGMMGDGLSLRVAALAPDRRSPLVPAPILAAAYAAENDALDAYQKNVEQVAALRRAAEQRRRLHEQAVHATTMLGMPSPPPLTVDVPDRIGARPRIVVLDGAGVAIRTAAAGGTGLLVVDEQRMPSMARVAGFYDLATEKLLGALARGDQVPVVDPAGRTLMQSLPASVVGGLTTPDCTTLHEVSAAAFVGTVFVPAVPPPIAGDGAALVALLCRVRAMGDDAIALRLPAQANTLATAAAAWAALAGHALPPLSNYLAGLPDIVRRLAALLHLAAAAGGDGQPAPEISPATVKRAVAIVDAVVLPIAQALLGPISTSQTERDARRVIAHLRETTSAAHRQFERRPLLRAWQNSMSTTRLDAALALLESAGLLVPLDKVDGGKGGQRFETAAVVYAAV